MEQLRTRRQTRASVLGALLASGGLFRPRLAEACRLTEASISRIVAELKQEALVEEIRRPAPYPGGPAQMVTLRKDLRLAGIEIAQDHLNIAIAPPRGPAEYAERLPLPASAPAARVQAVLGQGVAGLAAWCARQGVAPRQIGVAIPGFRGMAGPRNPILALDPAWLEGRLAAAFPEVPVETASSIVARAALHLQAEREAADAAPRLFVHLGHGVGGAWLEPQRAGDPIRPIEIGHVVLDPSGPLCRCGHQGCLEASASTTALARLFAVEEAALIAAGPDWPGCVRLTPARARALRRVLREVGLVIGNALNLLPGAQVVLSGWPASLPPPLRDAVTEGLDAALFGGVSPGTPPLIFVPPVLGGGAAAAIAFATHALLRRGGLPPLAGVAARLAG